jgi:ribonuclease Z
MPEPIDLFFLGTGAGIPTLARHHSAILLRRAGEHFLFDCGEAAQLGFERAKISPMKVSRIFISHWHADHFAGLLPLIESLHLSKRKEPLHIYGPEAARFVDALLELSYWGVGFDIRVTECPIDKPELIVKENDYEIYSVPVKHSVPAVGYFFKERSRWTIDMAKARAAGLGPSRDLQLLKESGELEVGKRTVYLKDIAHEKHGRSVAYSGDTLAYMPFFKFIQGCDLLIHDGTFIEPFPERAHADVKEVAALAVRYKIKRLILTHISHRYRDTVEMTREAKKIFKNTVVAEDNLRVSL